MSKRDLKQRLDELFSSQTGAEPSELPADIDASPAADAPLEEVARSAGAAEMSPAGYDELQSRLRQCATEQASLHDALQAERAERNRLKERLREDEELHRDLYENANILIQSATADGSFIYVNRAWKDVLGYTDADLSTLSLFDIIHPDSQAHCLAVFQRIIAGEHVDQIEAVFLAKDGRAVVVEGSTSCSFTDGKPVSTRGVFRDITERKRAEEALARRALQLQTAAEVSHAASSILNLDELFPQTAELVRGRFGLNYVGFFLVDEARRFAALRAGTGEAGRIMMERGHKLPLDDTSMIGWCIVHRTARIALEVGEEAVRFQNPLLPDTRSELALPLIARGQVLGAVTVQSAREGAFSDADIVVLQTMTDQVATAIENARLFEQIQTQAQELATTNEIIQALSQQIELPQVLEAVYQQVRRLIHLDAFIVGLYDEATHRVAYPLVYDEGRRYEESPRPLSAETRVGQTIQSGQPILVNRTPEELTAFMARGYSGLGKVAQPAASLIYLPLKFGSRVIGALSVQSYQFNVYHQKHVDLLMRMTSQVVIAIQNAQLFEQAQARAVEMAALNDLSRALASRLSVDQVLEEVYHGISRLLDTTNFYIALYDPTKHEVSFPINVTESVVDQQITVLSADQGITGYIVRTHESVLIKDGVAGWLHQRDMEHAGDPAQSWLGVPMMLGDQLLGAIAVQDYTTLHAYDERDRDMLAAIASQAAIAIQNARLYEQMQAALAESRRLAEHRRLINQITGRMRAALSVDEVLRIAAEELRQVTRSSRVVARLDAPGHAAGNGRTGRDANDPEMTP